MQKAIFLEDFVTLTQCLCNLASSPSKFLPLLDTTLFLLLRRLDRCSIPITSSHKATLKACMRRMHRFSEGDFTRDSLEELKNTANAILVSLLKEIEKKEILVLTTTTASARLKRLSKSVSLTSIQRHLVAETVRCIESGSFRAAVVMGWNLAYDYLRHWVWRATKRRASFNTALKARCTTKTGLPVYPKGIRRYEDFFTAKPMLNEWTVLEVMRDARLISVPVHDKLCHYLRDRNNFAHPNFRKPSDHKASAFIEDLLDIVTDSAFQ